MKRYNKNGSFAILSKYLKNIPAGTLLVYSDITQHVGYDCARSTVKRLCEDGYLFRVAYGVFVRLHENGSLPELDITKIAETLARKTGDSAVPSQKTIRDMTAGIPVESIKLVYYTTGSSRTVRLYNGIDIHFRHKLLFI